MDGVQLLQVCRANTRGGGGGGGWGKQRLLQAISATGYW